MQANRTDLGRGEPFVGRPNFVDPQFVRTLEARIPTEDGNANHGNAIAVELVDVAFKVLAAAGVCEIIEWNLGDCKLGASTRETGNGRRGT